MNEATFSLAEAARVCGVSRSTIQRKRDTLVSLGATARTTGWVIPISALVASGLAPRATPPATGSSTIPATAHAIPSATTATDELNTLRLRLAEVEKRAAVLEAEKHAAERVAQERERIINAQQLTLRMLEAPNDSTESNVAEHPEPAPPKQPSKCGWWPWRKHS